VILRGRNPSAPLVGWSDRGENFPIISVICKSNQEFSFDKPKRTENPLEIAASEQVQKSKIFLSIRRIKSNNNKISARSSHLGG
jgi:hypothetical protein